MPKMNVNEINIYNESPEMIFVAQKVQTIE